MKKKLGLYTCRRNPCMEKFLRIMRVTTFLLFAMFFQVSAAVFSQNGGLINLKAENEPLKEILKLIEDQSSNRFLYNSKNINVEQKKSVDCQAKSIEEVLKLLFNGTDIKYRSFEKTYVLFSEERDRLISARDLLISSQQQRIVSGKVTDSSGSPLPGVTIVVKGTTNGTVTNTDGEYSLSHIPGDASLQFSFVGMKTQEVSLNGKTTINVTMFEEEIGIEEVVAIGYGTLKKSDLTGSVASVSNKQFENQPVKRIEDILQGRTSGVEVTTLSGIPGSSVKVRIRGTTSINKSSDPLYIIDGMFSSTGLEGLNPTDIQSIEVLKDASATAMYGSRGANGVILVTTQKGEAGKSLVTAEATYGVSNMMLKYDLLNAYEYALALNDIWGSLTISSTDLEEYKSGTKGIDWMDIMTQTGISQDYKLSLTGGNAKSRYFISGDVLDMSAITITTRFKRYNIRANIDSKVYKWLTFSLRLNAARLQMHNGDVNLKAALNYSPTMEMTDEDGVYNTDPYNVADEDNPYGALKVNYNDDYRYYLNSNISFLFNIVDGLTFSILGGYNYSNNPYYSFISELSAPGQISEVQNTNTMDTYWQNTSNLTYKKSFGDHSLRATAVWEGSFSKTTYLSGSGSDLSNEVVEYWNIKNAATRDVSNGYSEESILSGIARIMYKYKERYFLTGTFRADGSSKFQGDNKWGYFPSGAIAWDMAKEEFLKEQDLFQQMKLRGSFGVTGNQGIDRYSTLGMLSSTSYGWGTSSSYTGYWGDSFATPDVRWEKTHQYDVGLDCSILNNKVNFSMDWFFKKTKDLLFQKSVPGYNGGGSYWVNQGQLNNKGFEFSVEAFPVSTSKLMWKTTFDASFVKNEIVDLAGEDYILDATYSNYGGSMQIMKPGYPLGAFYLYKWKGFNDEGANLYETADGSLTTSPTSSDQFIMGQSSPKWTFGWNNVINWKNWTASLFFYAATGFDRLNLTRFGMASMTGEFKFVTLRDAYLKGWDYVDSKGNAKFPSLTNSENENYGNSDFWLEDASFLKLKNISIAYRFPKRIISFADVQLSISTQNLFTLTKYKGMDPEVYNSYSGLDHGAYPVPRTFTLGAKVNF